MIYKKMIRAVDVLTAVFLFIFLVVLLYYIYRLGILPDKYYLILSISLCSFTLILDYILIKKTNNLFMQLLKFLVVIISFLLFVIFGYIIYYTGKTKEVFASFITKNEEITSYYFYSSKSSNYTEISDLDGKNIGYFLELDNVLKDKIKLDFNYILYSDSNLMINDLKDGIIDAIIINNLLLKVIEDQDDYKLLYKVSITNKIEDITKRVSIKNTPFIFLISGSDSRYDDINDISNNDVNIIVTINPNTNEVLLLSIPRDYYVKLHNKDGLNDKLTHASYYGINMHVQTVEDLFDIDINYYIKVNFNTVIHLVDSIGGIDIYSDKAFNTNGCYYKLGINNLDGKCALMFARERHVYTGGDRHRIRNQTDIIKAIFTKVKNDGSLIYDYDKILESINGEFLTNISIDEATNFIKYELRDIGNYKIYNYQVDGSNAMDYTYSYPNQKLYVMIPNQKDIDFSKNLINKMINNESINELIG